jgi:hypothetical protein
MGQVTGSGDRVRGQGQGTGSGGSTQGQGRARPGKGTIMKTRKAMKDYVCHECDVIIPKGDQYAKRSVSIGHSTIHPAGKLAPAWAWETVRATRKLCLDCSGGVS